MKAYGKEIFRTIRIERKRFLAFIVISSLGVLMMTGLKAGCNDTRISADNYYRSQHLHDFYIQSTLGLTDDDIEALEAVDGVSAASGFCEETAYYSCNDIIYSVLLSTWNETADTPYVVNGALPVSDTEIAVTQNFADKLDISVGDRLTFELDEDTSIETSNLAVCGVVLNVTDVNTAEGCTSFRSTASTDFAAYISPDAVNSEVYTGIALTLEKSGSCETYSGDYEQLVLNMSGKLAPVKTKRESERTQEIINDALDEIADKEKEMNEEFDKS